MHSGVELWQWVYWMVPTSVHKCERNEKFGCTGIFGSSIFYKHLQWHVDEAEWKCKTFPKEEKSIRYWKDIIFMLVLLLLSTVSTSLTQEISCRVNKEVKIDCISITRPSLADIFFIFVTFSALGYYFAVIAANLHVDQHCFSLGYAFPGHEPNICLKCDMPTYVHNSKFENIIQLRVTQTNNPQTTVISGLRKYTAPHVTLCWYKGWKNWLSH